MDFSSLPKAYVDLYKKVARPRTSPPPDLPKVSSTTEMMWGDPGPVPSFVDTCKKSVWAFSAIWRDWFEVWVRDSPAQNFLGRVYFHYQMLINGGTPAALIAKSFEEEPVAE